MNTLDYVNQYHATSFDQLPLTAVDGLIFADIVYLPTTLFVSDTVDIRQGISIKDFYTKFKRYTQKNEYNEFLITDYRLQLLAAMAKAKRYRDITLFAFEDIHINSKEMQFTALSYAIEDQQLVIAFRGTDDSLIGWKENFNVACAKVTDSQKSATAYIQSINDQYPTQPLTIVGHSKGGNLAVYGSGFQTKEVQEKIQHIYAYDSPGLLQTSIDEGDFDSLSNKTTYIVPNDSIIGRIMHYISPPQIVKSKRFSLMQHIPRYWEVKGTHFVRAEEFSLTSDIITEVIDRWMQERDPEEIAHFFNLLFDLLMANQTTSLLEIFDQPWYHFTILREKSKEYPEDEQVFLDRNLSSFFDLIRQVLSEYKDKRFNQWQKEWTGLFR